MSAETLRVFGAVLCGMAAFLGCHFLHWNRRPSNAPRMLQVAFWGFFGLCIALCITPAFEVFGFMALGIVFYLALYAGFARSVSFTLLTRLAQEHKPLPVQVLCSEYAASTRFEDRLTVLQDAGWVIRDGQQVTLTEKGDRVVARMLFLAQWLSDAMEG